MAVVVGPVLGLASVWIRDENRLRTGMAVGVVTAVPVGEGLWAHRTIVETTFGPYWLVEAGLGIVAFGVLAVKRTRTPRSAGMALTTFLVSVGAFLVVAGSVS